MFVEARIPDLPDFDYLKLKSLRKSEVKALLEIFKIYEVGRPADQITIAQDAVVNVMLEMHEYPYGPTVDKAWKKKILKDHIQPLAHPNVGRDRQAIALSYLVSAFLTHDRGELGECWKQLSMLRTQLEDIPFEF